MRIEAMTQRGQHAQAVRRVAWVGAGTAALMLALCAASARANFKNLAGRVPDASNAVVAINVEKVLATPYAKAEWAPNTPDSWAKQPIMIPPGSKRLVMASDVRTDTMEPYWEMCVMEMAQVPPLKALAAAEGGSIDRIWDKDAVISPINAYFIPLDGTTLVSVTPANRSAVAKWVRSAATRPSNVKSDYIQNVLAGLNDSGTDIVMAMDLEGAFGVPRIRRWLDENDIKEIKDKDLDAAARALGTMKGITLAVTVAQDVTGKIVVDFDGDASTLNPAAKSIMSGVLRTAGLRVNDVDQWTFAAAGKQVTAQGKLSTESLRNLLGIVSSPIPAAVIDDKPQSAEGGKAGDPAQASQRYYKAICGFLDGFSAQNSAADSAKWARNVSKRIDQLPILNVDPQLVQWGSLVSLKLKQAGTGMGTAQTQMDARVAGIADPAYSAYHYDNEGNYQSDINRGEMENARRQRRQVALEQKAQAQEQAVRVLAEIAETRPAIRAAMTEKYKVEF
jgi:hypothetical protein